MPAHELTERAADVLGVDASLVVYSLDHAGQARSLVRDDDRIYVPHLYHAERRVAELIRSRLLAAQGDAQVREQVRRWVESYAEQKKWQLDPKQRDACVQAAQGSVFVLTGGPGTGKTTALHVLVAYLRAHNKRVAMAAPTGRAAQRMGTVAGMQARTIHRLLEFRPGGGNRFGRTAERPVEADVVIIDEVSMVDISLMRSLLEALDVSTRLVLVGDSNQLPSIGPGSVLADFIASGRIGHVELTTVFRQAARSRIVTTAHDIIRGRVCHFDNAAGDDCFFVGAEEPHRCLATVVDLACTRLPSRYGFNPRMDIQILAPMHRGELGTQNINRLLQERLSSGGISYTRGEATYTTGDRVMQIRNNYDRGVFNGDIGYVTHITENGEMMVDFEGTSSVYEPHELDEITLAYCISIHKSQGCEFRGVIIPLGTQHYIMLRRNLVYTALTRARQLCVFVGSSRAFAMAVRNGDAMERYSRLGQRIRGEV